MGTNHYPARTVADIEELATAVNLEFISTVNGVSLIAPIAIEQIAEQFLGYQIDFSDEGIFSDPGILGGICFEDKTIYVNCSVADHDGRYAFTVAHELGHHILHRDYYLRDKSRERSEILCREVGKKPQIEIEADRFAAALLMPREILSNSVSGKIKKVKTLGQARALARDLITNGGFGNVSNSAMLNRLKDLCLLPADIPYQDGQKNRKTYGPFPKMGFLKNLMAKLQ